MRCIYSKQNVLSDLQDSLQLFLHFEKPVQPLLRFMLWLLGVSWLKWPDWSIVVSWDLHISKQVGLCNVKVILHELMLCSVMMHTVNTLQTRNRYFSWFGHSVGDPSWRECHLRSYASWSFIFALNSILASLRNSSDLAVQATQEKTTRPNIAHWYSILEMTPTRISAAECYWMTSLLRNWSPSAQMSWPPRYKQTRDPYDTPTIPSLFYFNEAQGVRYHYSTKQIWTLVSIMLVDSSPSKW